MGKTGIKPKHFLTINDITPNELLELLDSAIDLKTRGWIAPLKQKMMALVFEKPSLRTRVSFEVAMRQLADSHYICRRRRSVWASGSQFRMLPVC